MLREVSQLIVGKNAFTLVFPKKNVQVSLKVKSTSPLMFYLQKDLHP